jgi:phosphoribosylamine--glycine ligase
MYLKLTTHPMKILLLGSGGREHAFAWKMAQSPLCQKLYIAPGNAGTSQFGENVTIGVNDFAAIEKFVLQNQIDMVVVGPEDPLVNGIYDYFLASEALSKIPVIGPSKLGAQLEGSKAFSKVFMLKHGIPTAIYQEFSAHNLDAGLDYIEHQTPPIVLKADGLAAGKGVLICQTKEEAKAELREMIANAKFGKASSKVVIEQFLKGIEFSVFVLTDGINYKILPQAKDYKRIGEGDTGLNTGGMGCISPVPFVDEALMKKVEERVIIPTIQGLQKDKITYKGFIYIGFMQTEMPNGTTEPFVIEYNCRMGDPETEIVFPRIKSDLVQHFVALAKGELQNEVIETDPRAAATVIVASGGYPEDYQKGIEITGLDTIQNSIVFHAGTKAEGGKVLTNGGRVLAVTSYGKTITEAVATSNAAIEKINFDGKYYRRDIGFEFKSTPGV